MVYQVREIRSETRNQFLDITEELKKIVKTSGVSDGIMLVFCPHTTAGLTINENADPDVSADIIDEMVRQYPKKSLYKHFEGNSDAHIKSSLIGPSLSLIVQGGTLCLGRWQGVYFCEFDGPRSREFWVKIVAG
jgi:secondary thiamine-phosphate synthase enzyme